MSLQACADIVAKADPDRFAAAMAAPVAARRVLFPLYAFNAEVTKAAWIASEPMIGEMRLQWWRDAIVEIGQGGPVRKHEVTVPLQDVVDAQAAHRLDQLVAARRWDLYTDPFEDIGHFKEYLDRTGGALMWEAARALGATEDAKNTVWRYGFASALARFLMAASELEMRGRIPLLDGTAAGIVMRAENAWELMPNQRELRAKVPRPAWPALLEGWQTRGILKRAMLSPELVADGALKLSEFEKRARLIKASITGFA